MEQGVPLVHTVFQLIMARASRTRFTWDYKFFVVGHESREAANIAANEAQLGRR